MGILIGINFGKMEVPILGLNNQAMPTYMGIITAKKKMHGIPRLLKAPAVITAYTTTTNYCVGSHEKKDKSG